MKRRVQARRVVTARPPFDNGQQQQQEEAMLRFASMQASYYKGLVAGGMPEQIAADQARQTVMALVEMIASNPNFLKNLAGNGR